jgi:predicted restriction endonuclease
VPTPRSTQLRKDVFDIYGRTCVCCGETILAFLTLDHIDGNGAAHRRALGLGRAGGVRFYAKIIKLDKDPNIQVLCMNCNLAKHTQGQCPHATIEEEDQESPNLT